MFTLNITSSSSFKNESLHAQLSSLLNRAGVIEGDYLVTICRETTMRRENPVLRISSSSSVRCLVFATWIVYGSGKRRFMECELERTDQRKHGLIEKMKALATELNSEAEQALPLLQKSLVADSAMLKRILIRMRETKKKIRDMKAG